ncbi:hypothetical protein FRC06_005549 [Ceratobasidium sp. 370]|nr:hypothetical protein FRC06_005549 [Ceratobasidium sp. 370]
MLSFDFDHLRCLLSELPLPVPKSPSLDLRCYVPSTAGMEATKRINGAVNFDLECILGHKANGLTLSEAGPGVVVIVDVLEQFIRLFPCDEVLQLWPPAILEAVHNAYKNAPAPLSCSGGATWKKHMAPGHDQPGPTSDQDGEDMEPALDPRQKKKCKIIHKATSVPTWIDLLEQQLKAVVDFDIGTTMQLVTPH